MTTIRNTGGRVSAMRTRAAAVGLTPVLDEKRWCVYRDDQAHPPLIRDLSLHEADMWIEGYATAWRTLPRENVQSGSEAKA